MRLFRGAGVVVVLSCMLTIFSGATTDEDDRTLTEKKSGNTVIVEGTYFRLEDTNVRMPSWYHSCNLWYYDMDDDGDVDVVGTERKWNLEDPGYPYFAFLNTGDGSFIIKPKKAFGSVKNHSNGSYFLAADFTGDGRTDLFQNAEMYLANGTVYGAPNRLFAMTAKGKYQELSQTHLPQKKDHPHWHDAADIDADGDLDIFLATGQLEYTEDWEGENGEVYRDQAAPKMLVNNGSGYFEDVKEVLPELITNWTARFNQCTFIDVNKDGYADLLINGPYGDGVNLFDQNRDQILMNNGNGTFYFADPSTLPERYYGEDWGNQDVGVTLDTYGLTKADVNGDGWEDLLVTVWAYVGNKMPGTIQILINNKNGTFSNGFEIPEQKEMIDFVKPADINGDGWVDLICYPGQVFINLGKGVFKEYSSEMFPKHDRGSMNDNTPFDIDSDGDMDIIFRGTNGEKRTIYIWRNIQQFKPVKKKLKTPGKIKLKSPSDGGIAATGQTLVWKHKKRAINYRIQICQDKDFESFTSNDLDKEGYTGNELNLSKLLYQPGFEGLKPGTTYYWRVAGWNYSGFGKWSGVRSFTTE